jgi:hypothetical protein
LYTRKRSIYLKIDLLIYRRDGTYENFLKI